jgi:hypothetical protein
MANELTGGLPGDGRRVGARWLAGSGSIEVDRSAITPSSYAVEKLGNQVGRLGRAFEQE